MTALRGRRSARERGGGDEISGQIGGLFLCTGEGAHAAETDVPSLKASPLWSAVAAAVREHVGHELDFFLANHLGQHAAPGSPMVTTILNMLNADRWLAAGHMPTVVLGHSIGEVARMGRVLEPTPAILHLLVFSERVRDRREEAFGTVQAIRQGPARSLALVSIAVR